MKIQPLDALARFSQRLRPCPDEGGGVHAWLYHAACCAVEAGLSDEEAALEIAALMTRDPNPSSEVEDALAAARGGDTRRLPRWSKRNGARAAAIAADGPSLSELISYSPAPISFSAQSQAEFYVDLLFPGNPWLCVGQTDRHFLTERREFFRGRLAERSLIVPSPMTEQRGLTKRGRLSYHSEANTGPRRFLIVEFDTGSLDQQSAILWHLSQYAPLAAAVFSGSKSSHGWFYCENQPDDRLRRFFDYACSLGADPRMWLKSQFSRLPDGQRADNKRAAALETVGLTGVAYGRQAVLYFNPSAVR